MLDRFILPTVHRQLGGMARWLHHHGWLADRLTMLAFVVGILGACAIGCGAFWPGLLLVLLSRLGDGLDGMVARLAEPTAGGAFLDIVLDFVFYGAVVLGFAVADAGRNGLPAAALLFAFLCTGSSFLAFAVQAEKRGLTRNDYGKKGFYYMGGLTEGTETILFFVLACLFPRSFPVLAWSFVVLCLVTAVGRIVGGYRDLR